jgi:nucleoside triphosphate diphosphatase
MDPQRDSATDPAALFAEAVSIMARLRSPEGCPWDRDQTFDSIKPYTLEETYEVFDAIDRRHWQDLCDELGDLVLQVLFYAQMAAEAQHFTIADVIAGLNRKLIRRHPHVFGDEASAAAGNSAGTEMPTSGIDSAQVLRNWEAIKRAEKMDRPEQASALDSIPRTLPSLLEARKLGSRASRSGFDWPNVEGLFDKLQEEISELREVLPKEKTSSADASSVVPGTSRHAVASEPIVSEIGDLLFTVVNLARRLHVDPESALRHSNAKFRRRFAHMEADAPRPLETMPALELDSLWTKAKEAETAPTEP